ncbi:hypothetical protein [Micromonospora inyonensis]|uniref:hypothetical protein n=1 Tax=Micromonospora inyonensis TaxID=47866 RepID=UPI00159F23BC|nr:hypothetical protein [Micromonospora inyonensis]
MSFGPGRADGGLVIEPLDAVTAPRLTGDTAVTANGRATVDALPSRDGSVQVAVRDAGVLVTAEHTPDTESTVRRILASASLGRGATPVSPDAVRAAPVPATVTPSANSPQPGT